MKTTRKTVSGALLIAAVWAATCDGTGLSGAARALVEEDWERQEKVTRNLRCDDTRALDGVFSRGALLIADLRGLGAGDAATRAETQLAQIRSSGGNARAAYFAARWVLRELAFSNPCIDFDELLFVRRQWPALNHQCSHRVGEAQFPGANLCVLKGLSPDGTVRELLDAEHSRGGIGRPDLSYDAQRIVFPYARPRPKPTAYGYGRPDVRGGACLMYDIYEVGVDGTGLRQLTDNPDSEDTEPVYLPDGRVAFMSSRDQRFVQCGDWALACGMFTMAADGADIRRVTEPKEGEFYPSMLEDGRIMYTRWDYLMKGYNVIQQLWAVNPDGRAASLIYGDHYAFSVGPIAFFEARQIPGSSLVVCTGAAHHNTGAGPIMIVDLTQNRGTRRSMTNITPEVGYPEVNGNMLREVIQEEEPGQAIPRHRNGSGWYSSPYPLSRDHFLVTASFEANNAARHGYALYLIDRHGNKELIRREKGASCYSPIPVRPRLKPRVLPDLVDEAGTDAPAVLMVADVYQGLPGVPRGQAKYLRVLETYPKTVHTKPQRCDIGVNSGWDMRGVLGTVPVEEDGSAHFQAPTNRQLFFEVLDKDYLEIRRMRNFLSLLPGETRACVGCHEPPEAAPANQETGVPIAAKRLPSKIEPPPWGTEGFSFSRLVQPVLARHCVRCHDGSDGKDRSFDLRGTKMVSAPVGYDRDHAPHAQHLVSDSFLKLLEYVRYVRVGGYQGPKLPLGPYATGSRQSKLIRILQEDHKDVALGLADFRTIAAWIDCNAPYYGSWDEIQLPAPAPPRQTRAVTPVDDARIAERIRELGAGRGVEMTAYLDCGLQVLSDQGEARIQLLHGKGWVYRGTEAIKDLPECHRDIAFDERQIVFSISGLKPEAAYRVHMTWWDFNTDQRRQSVWVADPDGGAGKQLRKATGLPSYLVRGELPAEVVLSLPAASIKDGSTRLTIRREGGSNAVIGELWVTRDP